MTFLLGLLLSGIAAVVQGLTAYWGYRVAVRRPSKRQRVRYEVGFAVFGTLGVLAAIGLAGIRVVEEEAPRYDYAYLSPYTRSDDDQIIFLIHATNNLEFLKVARSVTNGEFVRGTRRDYGVIRRGAQADNIYLIPAGDWTLDVDSPGEYGPVWQHIVIKKNINGEPILLFSRVIRKSNKIILCQTPRVWITRRVPTCD